MIQRADAAPHVAIRCALFRLTADLPDGQINAGGGGLPVQPLSQKYFCFPEPQITFISVAIPAHTEGRLMIVTAAGRDAMDAAASGARIARQTNDAFADGEVVWS
jgi:hypothetical protein